MILYFLPFAKSAMRSPVANRVADFFNRTRCPTLNVFFFDLLFDDFVLTPSFSFTFFRTFSYSDLLIPSDFRRLEWPLPCLPAITSSAIFEIDSLDDFFLLLVFLVDDDEPFFFFNPKCLAIPFACPSAILFRNEFDLSLFASDFVSIKPFSVKIAGILVCRNTAKFAFLRPRLRQPVALTTSLLIARCTLPALELELNVL